MWSCGLQHCPPCHRSLCPCPPCACLPGPQVWLASYAGTQVAVKVLNQARCGTLSMSLQQQATLGRLQQEAQLMANLRHPNICRYLGACTDPAFIVLEYCSRRSLDTLLAEGLRNPKVERGRAGRQGGQGSSGSQPGTHSGRRGR